MMHGIEDEYTKMQVEIMATRLIHDTTLYHPIKFKAKLQDKPMGKIAVQLTTKYINQL